MKKDARLCMSTCVHVYSKAGLVLSHKVLLYFLLLSSEAVENIMCACVSQRRIKCEPEVAQVNTSQGGHFFMLTHVQVHPKVVLVASQVCLFLCVCRVSCTFKTTKNIRFVDFATTEENINEI